MAVSELFEIIFKDAFDAKGGKLTKIELEDTVDVKLNDDDSMRELMIEEIGRIQVDEDNKIGPKQIEAILTRTIKDQKTKFLDEEFDKNVARDTMMLSAGGLYAKQMIQRII